MAYILYNMSLEVALFNSFIKLHFTMDYGMDLIEAREKHKELKNTLE